MPFAATSYSLGLSSLSAGDYLLGTVAALPGYVRLGRLAHAGLTADAAAAGPLRPTLLAVGMVATLLLTLYGVRLVVQALRLDE